MQFLNQLFQLEKRKTTVGREVRGGFVTFFSMAYILVLNPIILSEPDSTGRFIGGSAEAPNTLAIAAMTAFIAGVVTFLMGFIANYPLALAAGLGLNSMLSYTVVKIPGMTWADGMGIIVLEGVLVLLLVVTGLRKKIFDAVPQFLRTAISVGIGLFVALIGLVNAHLITNTGGTTLSFGVNNSITTIPLLVFIIGLILTVILMVRKVPGAILLSIIVTTLLSIILEAIFHFGGLSDDNAQGWASGGTPSLPDGGLMKLPDFSILGHFSVVGPFQHAGAIVVIALVFSALLADFFDTMGTMVAVGAEGDLLDETGTPYNAQQILLVDSFGAIAGGAGSVSSNTAFVESASGVADGARTGLASIVTAILFFLSMFFAPVLNLVPSEAAAPALVVVGFLMMQQVSEIDWKDLSLAIPAFFTIIFMPFGYSITVGIGVGFIFYVLLRVAVGKAREVHPLMWITAALFVVYFVLDPLNKLIGIG